MCISPLVLCDTNGGGTARKYSPVRGSKLDVTKKGRYVKKQYMHSWHKSWSLSHTRRMSITHVSLKQLRAVLFPVYSKFPHNFLLSDRVLAHYNSTIVLENETADTEHPHLIAQMQHPKDKHCVTRPAMKQLSKLLQNKNTNPAAHNINWFRKKVDRFKVFFALSFFLSSVSMFLCAFPGNSKQQRTNEQARENYSKLNSTTFVKFVMHRG